MKKAIVMSMVFFFLSAAASVLAQTAADGGSRYADDGQWNYCPQCGRYLGPRNGESRGYYPTPPGYGMGPGPMGPQMSPGMIGPGYGMAPRMNDHRYGMPFGMRQPGWGFGLRSYDEAYPPLPNDSVDKDQAKNMVRNFLAESRNPNLRVGSVENRGDFYQVEVLTKDGSLVDKLVVQKDTGEMWSAYR